MDWDGWRNKRPRGEVVRLVLALAGRKAIDVVMVTRGSWYAAKGMLRDVEVAMTDVES